MIWASGISSKYTSFQAVIDEEKESLENGCTIQNSYIPSKIPLSHSKEFPNYVNNFSILKSNAPKNSLKLRTRQSMSKLPTEIVNIPSCSKQEPRVPHSEYTGVKPSGEFENYKVPNEL